MLDVRSINSHMKITEITLVPSKPENTESSATISSVIQGDQTQDLVSQDIVSENFVGTIEEHPDHSAIAEGVSQILRRTKGKAPSKDSDAHRVQGRVVSWPNHRPVSRRQTQLSRPRSGRSDSRRPVWLVRNWPKPRGQVRVH